LKKIKPKSIKAKNSNNEGCGKNAPFSFIKIHF